MNTTAVLDLIDRALRAPEVSPDAMRSMPEPVGTEAELLVVPVDGPCYTLALPGDTGGNLAAYRGAIGCDYVDVLRLPDAGLDIWFDEEGEAPINFRAAFLAHYVGGPSLLACGPVVISGGADADGRTLPLPPHLLRELRRLADAR